MNSIALLILQGVLSSLGLFVMKVYLGNAKASIVAGDFLDDGSNRILGNVVSIDQ